MEKSNQVKIITINKSGAFSKHENTLGKYYTCTKAVVDVRNLSKFPASATIAATFTSAAVVATVVVVMDATNGGFDEAVDEESSEPNLGGRPVPPELVMTICYLWASAWPRTPRPRCLLTSPDPPRSSASPPAPWRK